MLVDQASLWLARQPAGRSVAERWRFREQGSRKSTRVEALCEDVIGVECWEKGFRPLEFAVVRDSPWRHQFFSAFSDNRPIHLKEAHSSIACLKHSLCARSSLNRHHLLLSDNMSVCFALGKGRCIDPKLLQFCRCSCALQLATASRVTVRLVSVRIESH